MKNHQMCPAVTMFGDALALELEEPVDNPGTTISCVVLSVALDVSAFLG